MGGGRKRNSTRPDDFEFTMLHGLHPREDICATTEGGAGATGTPNEEGAIRCVHCAVLRVCARCRVRVECVRVLRRA